MEERVERSYPESNCKNFGEGREELS